MVFQFNLCMDHCLGIPCQIAIVNLTYVEHSLKPVAIAFYLEYIHKVEYDSHILNPHATKLLVQLELWIDFNNDVLVYLVFVCTILSYHNINMHTWINLLQELCS